MHLVKSKPAPVRSRKHLICIRFFTYLLLACDSVYEHLTNAEKSPKDVRQNLLESSLLNLLRKRARARERTGKYSTFSFGDVHVAE